MIEKDKFGGVSTGRNYRIATSVGFALLVLFSLPSLASKIVPVSSPTPVPEINAPVWALMEMNSGWIIAEQGANVVRAPASITKLMTNYVVFSELKKGTVALSDLVPISEEAWKAEGSRMFADVNTKIELEPLLKSTVIQSGNDASIALAEFLGGSEPAFAALMNKYAAELGLKQSRFTNSTGLPDDNHVMTALDILTLSAAIIRDFPNFYSWYSIKSYAHNNITQYNRNKLLWKDSSVDGLKTGFTDAAGYCLIATAKRGDQRWLAVVLGADGVREREKAVMSLLEYGFKNFQPITKLDDQGGLAALQVYGGDAEELRLQVPHPANLVIPNGRAADVVQVLEHGPYVEAPIKAGAALGSVSLTLDGIEIYNAPLVAMSTIKAAGWWKGITDSIKLRWRLFFDE